MNSEMKIGCARSTSIAVANALVAELKLGQFISEYEWVRGYALRGPTSAIREERITFRTNTGTRMHVDCTVHDGADIRTSTFPIARIVVALRSDRFSSEQARYFDCYFPEGVITITELNKWPL